MIWKLICVEECEMGGVNYKIGAIKKFYSLLKSKHFLEKSNNCFEILK